MDSIVRVSCRRGAFVLWTITLLAPALPAAALGPTGEADCVTTLSEPVFDGGTNGVNSVFAIDLDDDGDVDLLSASANDDTIAWYESDGMTPPGFKQRVISSNADGAVSVYAVDLDGDGDVDVLSASENDNRIAWYESNGEMPPGFIERVLLTDALNASSVYAADVDGDGNVDVLTASSGDNEIRVLSNSGTSPVQFTEKILTGSAFGASSVFAADIKKEPAMEPVVLEILSASRFDDRIAWYEELGLLCDDLETVCTVATQDADCVECPVGIPDCEEEEKVPIGSGFCAERVSTTTITTSADGASSVFAIDLDGDPAGTVDVLSASTNDDEIAWYRNDGADPPNFLKSIISNDADGAASVFAIDLDGDMDIDVLSASTFDNKIAWYENDGADPPAFTEHAVTTDAPGASSVYAATVDAGAVVDPVAASSISGQVAAADMIAWYENDGVMPLPGFTERVVSTGAPAPEAVLAVDVNLDGDIDVLVGSTSDDKISWFENDGVDPPGFTERIITMDVEQPIALFWADVNGDGPLDIVVGSSGSDGAVLWLENDGLDPPGFTEMLVSRNVEGVTSVFAIDLDDDTDIDVLSASADDDKIAWFENDGMDPPGFTQRIITTDANGARSVFAIDLDHDTDIDVLSASSTDSTIAWYENMGGMPPTFEVRTITATAFGAWSVYAIDLDEDADIDVVSAASQSDAVAWYENIGLNCGDLDATECTVDEDCSACPEENPDCLPREEEPIGTGLCRVRFVPQIITVSADFARQVMAIDLDGDLDNDVLSVSSGDDTIAWYENRRICDDIDQTPCTTDQECIDLGAANCLRQFLTHNIALASDSARQVAVADLDGDTFLDVVTGYFYAVAWHRGHSEEVCFGYDGNLDERIDGVEIIWLGQAFGDSCDDPDVPEAEWWQPVDANFDCTVDGDDLAILASFTVYGRSTADPPPEGESLCSFSCQ